MKKAAATRLAERGASARELMAIFGWRSIKQAENYMRKANRTRLASAGMQRLEKTERVENFPTPKSRSGAMGKKEAKNEENQ